MKTEKYLPSTAAMTTLNIAVSVAVVMLEDVGRRHDVIWLTRDGTRRSRGQVRIRSRRAKRQKGRKEDMVRELASTRKTSHALYVYFPLFIPASLLGQFGEPLLEVVAAGSSVPGLAIVVLRVQASVSRAVQGWHRLTGKKFLISECLTLFSKRSFLFRKRIYAARQRI